MIRGWIHRLLSSRAGVWLAIVVLAASVLPVQHLVSAQDSGTEGKDPPIVIDVDGERVTLTLGENVHPQTYDLLSRDPDSASDPSVKWVFVDDMWVPLARAGYAGQPPDSPEIDRGIDYDPECRITLNVPAYSQTGQTWSSLHMFNNPGCDTIGESGCAITSTAMVFSYFGASTDPGQLSSCCGTNGCYSPTCGIAWECAANSCSGGTSTYARWPAFSWGLLCEMLQQNSPPIVQVTGLSGQQHWVVVYKGLGDDMNQGWDYFINDSWDGSTYKRLSYYTNPASIVQYTAQ